MNAAASNKLANCSVDRHSAWYDEKTGLIWMLVWSRAAGIKKGEYCLWFYNHKAGAGKLWHFDDKLDPLPSIQQRQLDYPLLLHDDISGRNPL
jgi:hypothetical protein